MSPVAVASTSCRSHIPAGGAGGTQTLPRGAHCAERRRVRRHMDLVEVHDQHALGQRRPARAAPRPRHRSGAGGAQCVDAVPVVRRYRLDRPPRRRHRRSQQKIHRPVPYNGASAQALRTWAAVRNTSSTAHKSAATRYTLAALAATMAAIRRDGPDRSYIRAVNLAMNMRNRNRRVATVRPTRSLVTVPGCRSIRDLLRCRFGFGNHWEPRHGLLGPWVPVGGLPACRRCHSGQHAHNSINGILQLLSLHSTAP